MTQKEVPGCPRAEQPGLLRASAPVEVVGLDRSTYYDIKFRKPNDREIRRLLLADAIADIHARSRGTYGILRVKAALEIEQGLIVNTKLVKRIMRELGIRGLPGPKKGYKNLKNAPTCEDLVQRKFTATRPNELWLTDITEHPTRRREALLLRGARPLLAQGGRLGHRPTLRGRTGQRRPRQGRCIEDDVTDRRSSTRTTAASSPPGPSPRTSGAWDCSAPWAPSATATTTPPWSRSGARCRSSS